MKKNSMRLLGFLLMAMMMVSLFAVGVFAEDTGNVAKIGDTEYATLQDAMKACVAGDNTITLLTDCNEVFTFSWVKNVNITVDGNGNTFSGCITFAAKNGGTFTLTNANIVTEMDAFALRTSASTAPNITVQGCTVTGTSDFENDYGIQGIVRGTKSPNCDITVKDCTISKLYYPVYFNQGGKSATIENCEITECMYLISAGKCKNVTIKDVDYSGQYGILIKNETSGCALTLENVSMDTASDLRAAVRGSGTGSAYSVTVKGINTMTLNGVPYEGDTWFMADSEGFTVTLSEGAVINPAIYIGEQGYATLQAAIDAVKNGETIVFKAAIDEDVTIKQVEGISFTIDGAGNTFSGTMTIHGSARYDGAETLTIKKVKFVTDEAGHYFIDSNSTASDERYAHNVTVDNCLFTATGEAVNTAVALRIRQGFNISLTRSKGENLHSLFQGYGCTGFTAVGNRIEAGKNGLAIGTSTNVLIEGNEFTVSGYGVRADGTGAYDATLTANKITADLPVVVRKATGAYELTLSTIANKLVGTNENGYQVIFTNGDDGEYADPTGSFVLKGGENLNVYPTSDYTVSINGKGYFTLAAAIAAVKNGETIEFLTDISESVTIKQVSGKSFTIDGKGYEYYGTMTINGGANRAEKLTIQNVNFVATSAWQSCIDTPKGSNAHNLTIDGCSFTATGDAVHATYGIYLRNVYNITVKNTTAEKVYDLVYGNRAIYNGLTVESVTVTDSAYGFYLGYVNTFANFTNVKIDVTDVGIGIVSNASGLVTIENCEINAAKPVYVNENAALQTVKLALKGENVLTGDAWLTVNGQGAKVTVDLTASDLDISEAAFDETYYGIYTTAVAGKYEIAKREGAVAAIGKIVYTTITEAINAAQDDDTILVLKSTDEAVNIPVLNKSVTIIGQTGVVLSGGFNIGVDDHTNDNGKIYLNNLTFTGKGVALKDLDTVYVTACTFNNIEGNAIYVQADNFTTFTVIESNVINGATGAGIRIRSGKLVHIAANKISNVGDNCVTLETSMAANNGNIFIENNVLENWAQGDKHEGRAIRIALGNGDVTKLVSIVGNAMIYEGQAPEELVKITGTADATISVDENYWNGYSPIDNGIMNIEGLYPSNYYATYENGTLKDLTELVYVAQIGDKKYTSLQAAIDAVKDGETITFLADLDENVTIKQVADKSFTIDGNGFKYTATITIHGSARHNGAETLTIKKVKFVTDEAGHYFIDSNSTASAERYAHNVTVDNCLFTAIGEAENTAVALRIRQGFNIRLTRSMGENLHSLFQGYGCTGFTAVGNRIEAGKNGLAIGTSTNVLIEGNEFTVSGYGVRADGTGAYDATLIANKITADLPVVVRKATGAYELTLSTIANKLVGTNENGYQVIFTNGDDGEYADPTGAFVLNGGEKLNVYPTSDYTVSINGKGYFTLADAIAAVKNGETIVFLTDISESVTIKQTAGKSFTINGNGFKYTATITVDGSKRATGAETLTFTGINFKADASGQKSIVTLKSSLAHNITVDGCTFEGMGAAEKYFYGIYLSHAYNVTVKNTTATKVYDLVYGQTAVTGFTAEDVVVTDSVQGFMLSYVNSTATFKNVKISANDGISFNNNAKGTITLENCEITANRPIAAKTSGTAVVTLILQGENTLNGTDGKWLNLVATGAALIVDLTASDLDIHEVAFDETYYGIYTTAVAGKYEIAKREGAVAAIGNFMYNSLQAAIDAVKDGETIVFMADINEAVTIKQAKGISFTIDGAGKAFSGTITVNGNKRATGAETLTFTNINFVQATAGQIFIQTASGSNAHNITVDGCTFTGTDKTAYGMKIPNSYDVVVKNTTADGLFELVYGNKATYNFVAENVKITNSHNGFYLSYASGEMTFKGLDIDVVNNGVYVNNYNTGSVTFEDCTISGTNSVVLEQKNAIKAFNLIFNGTNVLDGNIIKVLGTDAPFTVTVNDSGMDMTKTLGLVAGVNNVYYNRQSDVFANAKDGDTINVLQTLVIDGPMTLQNLTFKAEAVNPAIRIVNNAFVAVNNVTFDTAAYAFILGASDGSSAGNLHIYDGSFHSGTSVVSVTKGELVIRDGSFSADAYNGSYAYLLNCIDASYADGSATITVRGGTFANWNPKNNKAEGEGTNFVADGFYAKDNGDGTYTVLPQIEITVTLDDKTMVLGNAIPELTYTVSDPAHADFIKVIFNELTVDATGAYEITATAEASDMYAITVVPATLTVAKSIVSVDGVHYDNWADASADIANGAESIVLFENIESESMLTIGYLRNKVTVLDLNGYTLDVEEITVKSTASFKVVNGTLITDRMLMEANNTVILGDDVDFNGALQMNNTKLWPGKLYVGDEELIGENGYFTIDQEDTAYLSLTLKEKLMDLTLTVGHLTLKKDLTTAPKQNITIHVYGTLTIDKGVTLTLDSETTLNINKNNYGEGKIDGEGTVVVNSAEQLALLVGRTTVVNVKLGSDITSDVTVDREMILDLNGKTLNGNLTVAANGKLYVVDTAMNGDYDAAGRVNGFVSVSGKLTLYAGTYKQNVVDYCAQYLTARNNMNGTWTVCVGNVYNKTTGRTFLTISDAMMDARMSAATHDTIMLLGDHYESVVIIFDGTTLDIGAHTLTADYVFGVNGGYLNAALPGSDGKNGGMLVAPKDRVALGADAYIDSKGYAIIQVWDKDLGAYIFSRANINMTSNAETGNKRGFYLETVDGMLMLTAKFKLQTTGYINKNILPDGQANHGVRVVVTASWYTPDGIITQSAIFSDEYVNGTFFADANGNVNDFKASVAINGHNDLVMTVQVITETGIVISTETVQAVPLVEAAMAAAEAAQAQS